MQLRNLSKKELTLNPHMPVTIYLSAPDENGLKKSVVREKVFVKDLPQVDSLIDIGAPKFPQEEIDRVNSNINLESVEKANKINEIIQKYYRELQEFEESGRELFVKEMRLLLMTREYLIQKYNFTRSNNKSNRDFTLSSLDITIKKTPEIGEYASVWAQCGYKLNEA